MTKTEFIEKIENGSDIMFDVPGHHYVIFTWMKDGIGIGEQSKDTPMTHFNNAEDLVENYKIGGVPLADLCDKIIITDYS